MVLCLVATSNCYIANYGNKRVQVVGPDLVFKEEFKCGGGSRGLRLDSLGTLAICGNSLWIDGLQ